MNPNPIHDYPFQGDSQLRAGADPATYQPAPVVVVQKVADVREHTTYVPQEKPVVVEKIRYVPRIPVTVTKYVKEIRAVNVGGKVFDVRMKGDESVPMMTFLTNYATSYTLYIRALVGKIDFTASLQDPPDGMTMEPSNEKVDGSTQAYTVKWTPGLNLISNGQSGVPGSIKILVSVTNVQDDDPETKARIEKQLSLSGKILRYPYVVFSGSKVGPEKADKIVAEVNQEMQRATPLHDIQRDTQAATSTGTPTGFSHDSLSEQESSAAAAAAAKENP
ncbi:MAG: hypothetical protein C5B49_06235 [Bdellovibrio sp.]|nr:MAG: hypothetical protein C5B49_06235 [Bdellovibrio sp.]